jgi:hypothetical protein
MSQREVSGKEHFALQIKGQGAALVQELAEYLHVIYVRPNHVLLGAVIQDELDREGSWGAKVTFFSAGGFTPNLSPRSLIGRNLPNFDRLPGSLFRFRHESLLSTQLGIDTMLACPLML